MVGYQVLNMRQRKLDDQAFALEHLVFEAEDVGQPAHERELGLNELLLYLQFLVVHL